MFVFFKTIVGVMHKCWASFGAFVLAMPKLMLGICCKIESNILLRINSLLLAKIILVKDYVTSVMKAIAMMIWLPLLSIGKPLCLKQKLALIIS